MRPVALDGFLDHLEQRLIDLLTVHGEFTGEEPMTRVLRVTLRHVEELDVGRVATDFVAKQAHVKVEILVVERQAHLLIHTLERRSTFGRDRHRVHLLRSHVGLERRQRLFVHALRHAVVHFRRERLDHLITHRAPVRTVQLKPPASLQSRHALQSTRFTHGHRVRRPRALKRQPRPHLHHRSLRLVRQRRRLPEQLRFVRLTQ